MKKISIHNNLTIFLSMVMLFGILAPAHSGFMELCDMMEMEHHSIPMSDMEDCPMESGTMDHRSGDTDPENCELNIGCDCDQDLTFTTMEATTVIQIQLPLAEISVLKEDDHPNFSDHLPPPIRFSDSYSPPPLFLANASFLI